MLKILFSQKFPLVAQWLTIWTRIYEDAGRSLASFSGLGIQRCCDRGVGCRCSSDPELLWLWCRLAAIAPIPQPGTPICHRFGPKKQKNKNKQTYIYICIYICVYIYTHIYKIFPNQFSFLHSIGKPLFYSFS